MTGLVSTVSSLFEDAFFRKSDLQNYNFSTTQNFFRGVSLSLNNIFSIVTILYLYEEGRGWMCMTHTCVVERGVACKTRMALQQEIKQVLRSCICIMCFKWCVSGRPFPKRSHFCWASTGTSSHVFWAWHLSSQYRVFTRSNGWTRLPPGRMVGHVKNRR